MQNSKINSSQAMTKGRVSMGVVVEVAPTTFRESPIYSLHPQFQRRVEYMQVNATTV